MRLLLRIAPVLFLAALFAQSDPPEKTARTILETKCAACHGAARMSDLDLRDRDTILKGGKRGPAIIPGKADQSLLYKAVRRDGELQMPPGTIIFEDPPAHDIHRGLLTRVFTPRKMSQHSKGDMIPPAAFCRNAS